LEELGKYQLASDALARVLAPSSRPLPESLAKVASGARRRVLASLKADQALLAKCTDHSSLVNMDQTLRLHLACSPPAAVASGASFDVVRCPSWVASCVCSVVGP
jgi:hypothetical protein